MRKTCRCVQGRKRERPKNWRPNVFKWRDPQGEKKADVDVGAQVMGAAVVRLATMRTWTHGSRSSTTVRRGTGFDDAVATGFRRVAVLLEPHSHDVGTFSPTVSTFSWSEWASLDYTVQHARWRRQHGWILGPSCVVHGTWQWRKWHRKSWHGNLAEQFVEHVSPS